MAAPTYIFYTTVYKGSVSQEEFDAEVSKAVSHVDWLIGWKVVPEEHETSYQMAVCACVDVFAEYGTGLIDGFAIGSFRMDRPNDGKFTAKELASTAAEEFLAPTGLLWSGL